MGSQIPGCMTCCHAWGQNSRRLNIKASPAPRMALGSLCPGFLGQESVRFLAFLCMLAKEVH